LFEKKLIKKTEIKEIAKKVEFKKIVAKIKFIYKIASKANANLYIKIYINFVLIIKIIYILIYC